MASLLDEIKERFLEFDFDGTKELVKRALEGGVEPTKIIEEALRPAMEIVGEKFEKGEFFLSELIVSGDLFKEVMDELIIPKLGKEMEKKLGKVVIGTVRGDLHDIGKSIVATMLRIAGFEVIDLGVDVPPEKFAEAVEEHRPQIVGMSALLTTTMIEMKNVIEELKRRRLRDGVKVIVGGAAVTEDYAKSIGADAYGRDAVEAVRICRRLVGMEG